MKFILNADEKLYCDECGDIIPVGKGFHYSHLPCNITSANKGESGSLCQKCNKIISDKLPPIITIVTPKVI